MLKNELCNYINDDKTADIERFIRAGASDNENDSNNLGRTLDIFHPYDYSHSQICFQFRSQGLVVGGAFQKTPVHESSLCSPCQSVGTKYFTRIFDIKKSVINTKICQQTGENSLSANLIDKNHVNSASPIREIEGVRGGFGLRNMMK